MREKQDYGYMTTRRVIRDRAEEASNDDDLLLESHRPFYKVCSATLKTPE
jgi:hypothetical protein